MGFADPQDAKTVRDKQSRDKHSIYHKKEEDIKNIEDDLPSIEDFNDTQESPPIPTI